MPVEPTTPRRNRVAIACGVGHMLACAGGIVFVVAMVMAGLRPNAELEGLYTLFGIAMALPVAGLTVMAISCLVSAFKGRTERSASAMLAAVETTLGVIFAYVVVWTVLGDPRIVYQLQRTRVPLLGPAVYLLLLGVTTVVALVRE